MDDLRLGRPFGGPALSGLRYTSCAASRREGTSPNRVGIRSCTGRESANFSHSKGASITLDCGLGHRPRRLAVLPVLPFLNGTGAASHCRVPPLFLSKSLNDQSPKVPIASCPLTKSWTCPPPAL